MSKPWMIVAGACGLMALVAVAKHSRRRDSTGASAPKTIEELGSGPRAKRSGWLAIEGGSDASGDAAGAREASGGSSAGSGLTGSGERSGSGRGSGRRWFGASTGYSGSDLIRAGANIDVDPGVFGDVGQRRGGGLGQARPSGTGTQELVKKDDKSTDLAAEDPNAPVLSLAFDQSTEADKGEQPSINENVTCGGDGEGCTFDADARFAIPNAGNLSGEAGSISFCLRPQWGADPTTNAGLVDLRTPNIWENRLKVFNNGKYFRFSIWPNSGIESGVAADVSAWQYGQWHPVTVTFGPDPATGANLASMYLDGVLVGQQPYDGQLDVPQQPLYIGSDLPGGEPSAGGSLMNFQAYNRVLPPAEASSFAAACPP